MTRRGRLVTLLVALMALSGSYAAPGRSIECSRTIASIVQQASGEEASPSRPSSALAATRSDTRHSAFAIAADPLAPFQPLLLARFQRPPPATRQ